MGGETGTPRYKMMLANKTKSKAKTAKEYYFRLSLIFHSLTIPITIKIYT